LESAHDPELFHKGCQLPPLLLLLLLLLPVPA
jgi:hypothetical protein